MAFLPGLKSRGILPTFFVKVILLAHTPEPEKVVAAAAKVCYSNSNIKTLYDKLTPENTANFIQKLVDMGHESPMEHVSFTFAIDGVSRSFLAQITRHRIASFSVRSQRYCTYESDDFVEPVLKTEKEKEIFNEAVKSAKDYYDKLIEAGANKEDARAVLPNAAQTCMMVTMNARELKHFFGLRCCNRAQAEIRTVAKEMLKLVKEVAPNLFKNAGPHCVSLGYCPEGSMGCGQVQKG